MRGNTRERWGSVSIWLHWAIAALILVVQVPAGILMLELEPGLWQNVLFNVHKNVGLVIFVMALARLGWRLANPVPQLPIDTPGWQMRIARLTHFLLYALLLSLPISGLLYTAFGGFPVPALMLYDLGQLVPASEPQAEVWKSIHYGAQYALYVVVVLHVGGALHHYLVHRDDVLQRMLTSR